MSRELLQQRITDYLSMGGLFNPEMANHDAVRDLLIDCRDELAKPEQEPVAVWELTEDGWDTIADAAWMETLPVGTKLYTAPPRKEWVGLTDEEIDRAIISTAPSFKPDDVARAIEAKLKEKNHGSV